MYNLIRMYYLTGRYTDAQLDASVAKGYITAAQAAQIRADAQAAVDSVITETTPA